MSLGLIVALVFFLISVILAIINKETRSAPIWAWWAIFAVLFFGAHFDLVL